jgi:rubrerythrin
MGSYLFFEKAVQLELLSAAIYRALAEQFQGQAEALALFQKLEEEEVQHAQRVQLLAARYRHDSRLFEDVSAALAPIDALLVEAGAILDQIAARAWGGESLEAVKGKLVALEDRFSVAHAHVIATAADPGLRSFFEQMAAQDLGHRQLLRG